MSDTENAINTSYLERSHPIRQMLEAAASGGALPTRARLDELAAIDARHLPDGESVARFRRAISGAAEEAAAIRATGANLEARRCADAHVAALARQMTPAERALDVSEAEPEPLDAIASRMFGVR